MTAPARYQRNSADVQAMRLEEPSDLWEAIWWLDRCGVRAVLGGGNSVTIYGPGSRMVARLGDWLTLDERTGAFSVERGDADGPEGHERRGDL